LTCRQSKIKVQIVSPHYDRNLGATQELPGNGERGDTPDAEAIDGAAEALREAELESAQPGKRVASGEDEDEVLDAMSIDELREFAASLNVPYRAQLVSRDELIAAIRGLA
jgi:hypothetical protein